MKSIYPFKCSFDKNSQTETTFGYTFVLTVQLEISQKSIAFCSCNAHDIQMKNLSSFNAPKFSADKYDKTAVDRKIIPTHACILNMQL